MKRQRMECRLRFLEIVGIVALLLSMNIFTSHAAEHPEGRVLFISSYSYAWDTVQMQIEGISDTLGPDITLDYEFMDTKRVDTEEAKQLFYEGLKYRLSKVEPYDAVIVGDDAALLFALKYQEELFDQIPIIFEGVNDETLAAEAAEDPFVTGIVEKLSVEDNIDLGLALNPDAGRVVAILDDTVTGQAERTRFFSCAEKYPQLKFEEINTSELTSSKLTSALMTVKKDSILIFVVMTEDASGKQYSSIEAAQVIEHYAGVPCLRMVEAGIGDGFLGGNVVSMYKSGQIAAQMALDIIKGKDCSKIKMVTESPNIYCIDEVIMKKFNLDISSLPEGTQILNHEVSFMEKYRKVLIPSSMLMVASLIVILVVCIDNARRRKLMEELNNAKNIMELASLHDFLTGLPNRNKFMQDLQTTIAQKSPCVVMMIDIDNFKKINDTMGHTAGDDALKQVAARLKELQSQILTAYRFAGDEFIIIMKSNQAKLVEKTAFSLKQLFSDPFILNGEKKPICGSIGIAFYPQDTDNLEQLIAYADDAMYTVKKNGKNDYAYYSKKGD